MRQRLFHDGRGIDEDLDILSGARGKTARNVLQLALDDVMIVAVLRIDGYGRAILLFQNGERIGVRPVIHGQHHDGTDFRPQYARIGAAGFRFLHPVHIGVMAVGNILAQPFRRLRNCIGRGEGNRVETSRLRLFDQEALEFLFARSP